MCSKRYMDTFVVRFLRDASSLQLSGPCSMDPAFSERTSYWPRVGWYAVA